MKIEEQRFVRLPRGLSLVFVAEGRAYFAGAGEAMPSGDLSLQQVAERTLIPAFAALRHATEEGPDR